MIESEVPGSEKVIDLSVEVGTWETEKDGLVDAMKVTASSD